MCPLYVKRFHKGYGFILLVAFGKGFLATKIGGGVTTIGMIIGLAVILSAFVLTGIYTQRANRAHKKRPGSAGLKVRA